MPSLKRSHRFIFILLFQVVLPNATLAQEKIKIGIAVPLTGNAATYGVDIKNAIVLANEKITGNKYQLIIEDDQCLDREAVTLAHRFANVHKVKYMLGFGCSGTVLASAPVYEKAGIIVIASGTGAPAITDAGDYIFRTKPSLNIAAEKLAQDITKKHKILGIITEETAYCRGLTNSVIEQIDKNSLKVQDQSYLTQESDFKTLLFKLKSQGVDALFINSQAESQFNNIYKQLLEINWKPQVYGTFMPNSPTFLDVFKERADGVIYADLPFNEQMLNEVGMKVFNEYVSKHGKARTSEHFITLSYSAFEALDEAISRSENVKDYLYKTNFSGIILGGFSFDKNGDVVSDKITYVLKIIKEGKPAAYS